MIKYTTPSIQKESKVVLDYLDNLKRCDFDAFSKLSTSYFIQQTWPTPLGLSARTKNEDIENLHTFRGSLNGAPLEVRSAQTLVSPSFYRADCKQRLLYKVNENKGRN